MFLSAFGMERSGTEKADKNFVSRRKFLCQDLIWTLVAKRPSPLIGFVKKSVQAIS